MEWRKTQTEPNIFWDAETAKISPLHTHLKSIWRAAVLQGCGKRKPLAERVQRSPPTPSQEAALAAMSCRHGHRAGGCQGQQTCCDPPQPTTSPAPSTGQVDTLWLGGRRGWNWNFATRVENRCPTKEVAQFTHLLSLAKVGLVSPHSGFHPRSLSCILPSSPAKGEAWPSASPLGGNTQSTSVAENLGATSAISL